MSWHSIKWWDLPEKKTILIQKKRGIFRLLSAPDRCIKRKVKSIYKKLVKKEPKKTVKIPNILENNVNNVEKLKKTNRWVKRDC